MPTRPVSRPADAHASWEWESAGRTRDQRPRPGPPTATYRPIGGEGAFRGRSRPPGGTVPVRSANAGGIVRAASPALLLGGGREPQHTTIRSPGQSPLRGNKLVTTTYPTRSVDDPDRRERDLQYPQISSTPRGIETPPGHSGATTPAGWGIYCRGARPLSALSSLEKCHSTCTRSSSIVLSSPLLLPRAPLWSERTRLAGYAAKSSRS